MIIAMIAPATGCFVYHKPEFHGQILEFDTKQPIEEAVVVAVYNKRTMGLGAGAFTSIINVKETLTDKAGSFHIPSYTSLINPFSWASDTTFIIYKPGYASLEMGLEDDFTGKVDKHRDVPSLGNRNVKVRIEGFGIIELPILKTREERWHASIIGVTGYSEKELPLLYKARNNEDKTLGAK